ncbi:MAG: alcohol dehydrogenase [Glaciihabitans sp.]|nr:alcohol dehydrogenase [Glaciihabitans sp.]
MTVKQVRLGSSGLEISSVILGCMSYGDPQLGNHSWSVGLEESRPFFEQALELGITTFDTANVYSIGTSEEITGKLLGQLAKREDVVIATKVHGRMRPGPHGAGLSRGAILHEIDASLRRLNTDYVDLYQIHRFDPTVPVEETMETLHDIVRSGKARYIGASSMFAWQFAKLQSAAERNGWTNFISMQDQYNLLSREEEREMHPYCLDTGVGAIPWSPLARGRLARAWDETTTRGETDNVTAMLYKQTEGSDRQIVDAVSAIAAERGVPMAQVALAWVAQQEVVDAPIVGATKPHHLVDAVAAVDIALSAEELKRLEEHYQPHAPEGF